MGYQSSLYGLGSKLLVSPLISPVVVPHIDSYMAPLSGSLDYRSYSNFTRIMALKDYVRPTFRNTSILCYILLLS